MNHILTRRCILILTARILIDIALVVFCLFHFFFSLPFCFAHVQRTKLAIPVSARYAISFRIVCLTFEKISNTILSVLFKKKQKTDNMTLTEYLPTIIEVHSIFALSAHFRQPPTCGT